MLRLLIAIFIIVVVFEGAIRKWVLPEYSNEVFVLKDVILILTFAVYLMQRKHNVPRLSDSAVWILWVLLVVGFAAIEGFSFKSLVGLRYYLAPLPLIFLMPALIHKPRDLDWVATWLVRISIPIGILAVIQYFSPYNSPLNMYAWAGSTEKIAVFGIGETDLFSKVIRPRVTSTFSYISTYASFLNVAWLASWLSALHSRTRLNRYLAYFVLILIFFNMSMTGSRAPLIIAVVTGLPFFMALLWQLGVLRSQLLVAFFAIAIGYMGVSIFEPFVLTAVRSSKEEATVRITGAFLIPLETFSAIDVLGNGIGSTFGGYKQLNDRETVEGFDEINLDRIGIELGMLGYLLVLIAKILMLLKAFRVYRRVSLKELRHWALAALFIQLSSIWQIPFYNSVAAIFYFSAIGLVFWIDLEIKRQRIFAMHSPILNRPGKALAARGWR